MIRHIQIFRGESTDPYYNLAVEEHLMETVPKGHCILYLWQNRSTVVIGRNQNAWKECRTTLLEREGGQLARRLSGGGAVFHDLGNLNFTFMAPSEDYDVRRRLSVVCRACQSLRIPAEPTGRNDVTAKGRKFSGNAFYRHRGRSCHHGTLLVHVDLERLSRYLSPSQAKLEAKGVNSVRSRVVNLREYCPGLTCEAMGRQMEEAFQSVYGLTAVILPRERLDAGAVEALRLRNGSREWLYGQKLPFTFSCERRFLWGDLQLQLRVEGGVVRETRVYSDAMEWEVAPTLETALQGCLFGLQPLRDRIHGLPLRTEIRRDLCRLLEEQEI